VAALAVASSFGPAALSQTQPAMAAGTVPYVDPPAPTPPNPMPPRPTGKLVPAQGALFGIHTIPDSPTATSAAQMGITQREADAGRTLDIDNHYYPNFDAAKPLSGAKPTLPGWREQWDIQSGRIPMISWGGADVIDIVNGKYDAAIDAAATRLQALGAPFFLRWFWEPDGTRASKADKSHTPADYIKAWRYIHDRFAKDGNTNAVWVWCPVSLDFYPPPGQSDPNLAPDHAINPLGAQPYYPGDDVVDWMCADGYNWAPNLAGARYEPFQELFQAFYNWSVPHNKPLMIGETGVQENNPGDKANWINAMHTSLVQHYPNIVAFDYFDTKNANGLSNEWWLQSSPDAYQAWIKMAQDPYFNQKNTLPPPYGTAGTVTPPPSGPPTGPPTGPPVTTPPVTQPNPPGDQAAAVSEGYWMLGTDSKVYPFGAAKSFGDGPAGVAAVDLEPTPSGQGYWILSADGRVTPFGDATALGNVDMTHLAPGETVSSLSATPSGKGYWVFTSRGRALAFGDATFLGDVSKLSLNGPVLGSVATPSGRGYYMVASDGGIFAFGDAKFDGSMGAKHLNAPVESLVPTATGAGYWLVASDGGIFAFGDAAFKGSMGGTRLNKPVVGMVRYGDGYLMVGADGGIFDFSSSPFAGSLGGHPPAHPIVAVAALG
jgi:hypothetical protein